MKNFLRILLCLALSGFTIARAVSPAPKSSTKPNTAEKKPSGQKADAKTLLTDAKKALAAMIKEARADSVKVVWPDRRTQVLVSVAADQTLTLSWSDAKDMAPIGPVGSILPL